MKRLFLVTLTVLLVFSLAACAVDSSSLQGSGTEADPYQISTADQLRHYGKLINEDDAYANACYILTADIDLEGKSWAPMGTDAHSFGGVFDGSHYTVRNFKIQDNSRDVGFFGRVTGTVRNLTIANAKISTKNDSAPVGGLVGELWGGTLENCHTTSDVTVTGYYQIGGICGSASDKAALRDLTNGAAVSGVGNISCAGGIAGRAACLVERCVNTGAVASEADAGGIAETMNGGAVDCVNEGSVTGAKYAGGIVGHFSDGALNHSENNAAVELLRCVNSGSISAGWDGAGIAVSCRTGKLTDCANSGAVTAGYNCGGIFAYFQISSFGGACEEFVVSGCANSGAVTNNSGDALYHAGGIGGLVYGEKTRIVIENCANSGEVQTLGCAGGILGWGEVVDIRLQNCANSGSVQGTYCTGGLMGRAIPLEDGTSRFLAENCVNEGDVYCEKPYAYFEEHYCGGILGRRDVHTLSEVGFAEAEFVGCSNSGTLSGNTEGIRLCIHDLCGTMESQLW